MFLVMDMFSLLSKFGKILLGKGNVGGTVRFESLFIFIVGTGRFTGYSFSLSRIFSFPCTISATFQSSCTSVAPSIGGALALALEEVFCTPLLKAL